jgi:hypothetical protein
VTPKQSGVTTYDSQGAVTSGFLSSKPTKSEKKFSAAGELILDLSVFDRHELG